eukprot:TRINITY_DN27573_c0_g1_i2.p1 TRINITY_DN27573_c0_g1~~TRINITY_DN27573_c0_g1_i2.p1  ORF type:complete len:151 (+),score=20.99 TRINITY_DN27573_c0_g1_i2:148-600(+)
MERNRGEGTSNIRFCVEELGATRLGHGILCAGDSGLTELLREKGVCLEVCPSSNVLLQCVESIELHPLRQMIHDGVTCTINSDDPLLFGCRLLSEFEACRDQMGLTDEQLASCARSSFVWSHAPEPMKQKALERIDNWLQEAHSAHMYAQ